MRAVVVKTPFKPLNYVQFSSTSNPGEGDTPTSPGAVHIINLRHVSKMDVIGLPKPGVWPTDPASLPEINLQKVQRRLDQNVEARWREVKSKGVNVSDDAQQLFDSIRKM